MKEARIYIEGNVNDHIKGIIRDEILEKLSSDDSVCEHTGMIVPIDRNFPIQIKFNNL